MIIMVLITLKRVLEIEKKDNIYHFLLENVESLIFHLGTYLVMVNVINIKS